MRNGIIYQALNVMPKNLGMPEIEPVYVANRKTNYLSSFKVRIPIFRNTDLRT